MPSRGIQFQQGHYYHLYNRGAARQGIFFKPGHYDYFKHQMQKYSAQCSVQIIAYCLMPNHYHFLALQANDMPLSKFMSLLFNSYSQAINKDMKRTGALFEGRFKHRWISEEGYLEELCRYIHLNPVRAGLVSMPEDWQHSDYLDFLGRLAVKSDSLLTSLLGSSDNYRDFVRAGLTTGESAEILSFLIE